jgi:DNA-binding transcriptional MerR regulator
MSHSTGASPTLAVVGIARLAETTGASLRALRYYEEIGLLRPFRTANRARLFTGHQCEIAAMIVLLRRLDVSVVEIRALIDQASSDTDRAGRLRQTLERKAEELGERLREVRIALAETDFGHETLSAA